MKLLYFSIIFALCVGFSVTFSEKGEVYCGRRLVQVINFVCSDVHRDVKKSKYILKNSRFFKNLFLFLKYRRLTDPPNGQQ